jgi:hypothetical protein
VLKGCHLGTLIRSLILPEARCGVAASGLDVARRIERQLRLIVVGIPGWRSRPEPPSAPGRT